MERIEIDLGFATLVAEKGIDKDYRELNVYLEDKDGMWLQDIVVIGQKVSLRERFGSSSGQGNCHQSVVRRKQRRLYT